MNVKVINNFHYTIKIIPKLKQTVILSTTLNSKWISSGFVQLVLQVDNYRMHHSFLLVMQLSFYVVSVVVFDGHLQFESLLVTGLPGRFVVGVVEVVEIAKVVVMGQEAKFRGGLSYCKKQ